MIRSTLAFFGVFTAMFAALGLNGVQALVIASVSVLFVPCCHYGHYGDQGYDDGPLR